jgi:hypothetical protein
MKSDPLSELLNKLVAICETFGRGTYSELADHLGKSRQQVVTWLTVRDHEPSGRVAIQMHDWAAAKTLEISKRKLDEDYRREFKIACLKFPLNGKRK